MCNCSKPPATVTADEAAQAAAGAADRVTAATAPAAPPDDYSFQTSPVGDLEPAAR